MTNLGTESWMFKHDGRVAELLDEAVATLNSCGEYEYVLSV